MARRFTIDEVIVIIQDKDEKVELLTTHYLGRDQKLKLYCKRCEKTFYKTLKHIKRGNACNYCHIGGKKTIEELQKLVNNLNQHIVLLSVSPKKSKEKMKMECKRCKTVFYKTLDHYKKFPKCKKCDYDRKYSLQFIQQTVSSINPNLKLISERFSEGKRYIKCLCKKCGNSYETSSTKLIRGVNCFVCSYNSRNILRGSKHPWYNHNLTYQDRLGRNSFKMNKWKKEVYSKDDFKCVICKTTDKLNAHHLNGFHWFEEGRFDVSNGITLCTYHHKDFHNNYGYKNNTKEQFDEYLKHAQ